MWYPVLNDFIKNRIQQNLPFVVNEGQDVLLDKIAQFITSSDPRKAFILRGYAGTGKTSIMAALVQALRQLQQRIVLLAPTGRAAKVLSHYAHTSAYTIHKYIYRQKQLGEEVFSLNDNLHPSTLFIVDEASMISGKRDNHNFGSGMLLDDLVKFVYSAPGCSLFLLGDDAQLPPIGSLESPALNEDYMAGYQLDITSHTLVQVARQALDSGILDNANRLRPLALGQQRLSGRRVEEEMWQLLHLSHDVVTVNGVTLQEELERSYSQVGEEETILLTRTNRRTNIYNQGIRTRILWRDEEIATGDRLMVSKNNYFWTEKYENLPFLANGDMLEIVRLRNLREMYGYHFVDAQLKALDYDWEIDVVLWLDTMSSDGPEANTQMHKDLFCKVAEDFPELAHNRKKLVEAIYSSPYYNALQVRMAYAITGHKSQGGQWSRVFIDPYKGGDSATVQTPEQQQEFYRWLYTAITRAKEKVYILKNEVSD
jgi:exodeoxyribonuclease-5